MYDVQEYKGQGIETLLIEASLGRGIPLVGWGMGGTGGSGGWGWGKACGGGGGPSQAPPGGKVYAGQAVVVAVVGGPVGIPARKINRT